MKKFLITSSILMSIVFAGENDLIEKQRVSCRPGSILSMIGSCLGLQDAYETKEKAEPTVVSIYPNTVPDHIFQSFIRERMNANHSVYVQIEGVIHAIQFIEDIQPNSNWINIVFRANPDRKSIVDWRKISLIYDV